MAVVNQIMCAPPDGDRAAPQAVLQTRLGCLGIMRTTPDVGTAYLTAVVLSHAALDRGLNYFWQFASPQASASRRFWRGCIPPWSS